jgi:glycosyltransferase involved in cell wall biosynthesis
MVNTINSNQSQTRIWVTVIIPTYKRVGLLSYVLTALRLQSYKDFDIVVVVKPSGDGTEELLKQEAAFLKIKAVIQPNGHFVDACFLGAKNSTGDIVAFLDDDAIPDDNWLEETVKAFKQFKAGAVTGDSSPAYLRNGGKIEVIEETEVPTYFSSFEFAWFGRPLSGLEGYKNSIADSGLVYERGNNAYWRKKNSTKALPRGPSMAVWGPFMRSLDFPSSDWILGGAWEMMIGWQLRRKGFLMVYSPKVHVYHIVHGRTASRDFMTPRMDLLWAVEAELLFYRLYSIEPEFTILKKLKSDLMRLLHTIKYVKTNPKYYVGLLKGILVGNIIGVKWIVYKTIGCKYSPLYDLERLRSH